MECPKCKKEIDCSAKFCNYCGCNILQVYLEEEKKGYRILFLLIVLVVLMFPFSKFLRLKYIDYRKTKMFESGYFLDSSFTNKQIFDIADIAEQKYFTSQLQLQDFLHDSGYGSVSHSFTLQNSGKVYIYVYNENLSLSEFSSAMTENEKLNNK